MAFAKINASEAINPAFLPARPFSFYSSRRENYSRPEEKEGEMRKKADERRRLEGQIKQ